MTNQPFQVLRDDAGPTAGVGTLILDAPGRPVVVLDLPLMQRLELTLRQLPGGLRGLVIASSSPRAFVAGADLKAITELSDPELDTYLQYGSKVFGMIADLPFTTAAAISGPALGGGLEIAMHCDGLIGAPAPDRDGQPAKPYAIGLVEASLSICPGWGGTNLFPARVDPALAMRRTASGAPLLFTEAADAGLFDAVAPSASALLDTAKAWVTNTPRPARDGSPSRWIGRSRHAAACVQAADSVRDELTGSDTGRSVLAAVDAGLLKGWQEALAVERRELIRLRHTPPAVQAIKAFFERSSKK